jgi:hypothetical protein
LNRIAEFLSVVCVYVCVCTVRGKCLGYKHVSIRDPALPRVPDFTILSNFQNTVVPPYPRVIRFKTYRGYVKQRIIPNAIYNVIFV